MRRLLLPFMFITLFGSCSLLYKTAFNIKEPKIYDSRLESHRLIKKNIEKKIPYKWVVLYRNEGYLKSTKDYSPYRRDVRIFNNKGQLPDYNESVELCETYDMKFTAFTSGDYSIDSVSWSQEDSLSKYLDLLETLDSSYYNLDYSRYDYIILMDYTTYAKGPQNRSLRKLKKENVFNQDDDLFYIFLNKDIVRGSHFWNYKKSQSIKVEEKNNED